jgi:hypothetical protein
MNIKTLLTLSLLVASFNAQSAVTACPSGWTKSADGLSCVLETKTTQTPNQVSNTTKPVCISGFTYSSTSMKCEQINNASTYSSYKQYQYLSGLRFGPNPQEESNSSCSNGCYACYDIRGNYGSPPGEIFGQPMCKYWSYSEIITALNGQPISSWGTYTGSCSTTQSQVWITASQLAETYGLWRAFCSY